MTYILAADGRDDDVGGAFRRYQAYLKAKRERFPPAAYALATSDWWFNFNDHRCPHDSWVESVEFVESRARDGRRFKNSLALRVRLLGAYHDDHIELYYPQVFGYSLSCESSGGHRDWRYDELRVTDEGRLVHEIEWWGATETGRWLIEASDLEYRCNYGDTVQNSQ